MNYRLDIKNLINGLNSYEYKAKIAIKTYAETSAKNLEQYAKTHRKWTDRTNRARLGLTGYVKQSEKGYIIYLAHTVDYGLWLEFAHEKRFAILEPTIRLQGPKVLKGMENLLNRLRI